MPAEKNRPGRGWLTRKELAAAFDVGESSFDKTYLRFVTGDAKKTVGKTDYFHARTLLDRWAEHQGSRRLGTDPEVDPLLAGADSPALEEYRRHAAREKKVKADYAEGAAVPTEDIEPAFLRAAEPLRRAGEELAKRYGNEAGEIHNQAVDGWLEGVKSYLRESGREPVVQSV